MIVTEKQLHAIRAYTGNAGWELSKSGKTLTVYWEDGTTSTVPMSEILPDEEIKGDLVTRQRVQVVLDRKLYAKLQAYSDETKIPVSRLLDKAIKETYKF